MKTDTQEKAVALDYTLDRGLLPVGEVVTLATATFGYRGRLVAVTPDHYFLGGTPADPSAAEGYVKIIDYGQMDAYAGGKNSNAENGERHCAGYAVIERSANVAIEVSAAWQARAKK